MPSRTTFAALALTTAAMIRPGAAAAAPYWPWCGAFYHADVVQYCAFKSFEQCMESVPGIGGYCYKNLLPPPPAPAAPTPKRRARHEALRQR